MDHQRLPRPQGNSRDQGRMRMGQRSHPPGNREALRGSQGLRLLKDMSITPWRSSRLSDTSCSTTRQWLTSRGTERSSPSNYQIDSDHRASGRLCSNSRTCSRRRYGSSVPDGPDGRVRGRLVVTDARRTARPSHPAGRSALACRRGRLRVLSLVILPRSPSCGDETQARTASRRASEW